MAVNFIATVGFYVKSRLSVSQKIVETVGRKFSVSGQTEIADLNVRFRP